MTVRLLVLAAAALLCVATSAPRYSYPRAYPTWRLDTGDVWVSKSGKEGFGISSTRKDIVAGRFRAEALVVDALPPLHDTATSVYLGFVFDNQRLWNDGVRAGTLELTLANGEVITYPLRHVWPEPHHKVDRYDRQPKPPVRRGGDDAMPMVPR